MIGLVIGSKNTVAACIDGNQPKIILSETSKRQIPTLIGFTEKETFFAESALTTYKSNWSNTISVLNRLGGLPPNHPQVEEEQLYSMAKITEGPHSALFMISAYGENMNLEPEHALACFMVKLKQYLTGLNHTPKALTIAVPDYFTLPERHCLIDSCNLADIPISNLINESVAISLSYSFNRPEEFFTSSSYVLFVDVGYSKTTAFIAKFEGNQANRYSQIGTVFFDRNCGIRQMDKLITDMLLEKFDSTYNLKASQNKKCRIRVNSEVERARKILTSNKVTTVSVESLLEDEDLIIDLTRDQFNQLIHPIVEKFQAVLFNLLSQHSDLLQKCVSVEMAGDGLRVPILQETVESVFQRSISRQVTTDEAIATGCALYGALKSDYYPQKGFEVFNTNLYDLTVVSEGETAKIIFEKGASLPSQQQMSLFFGDKSNLSVFVLYGTYLLSTYTFEGSPGAKLNLCFEVNTGMILVIKEQALIQGGLAIEAKYKIANTFGNDNKAEMKDNLRRIASMDKQAKATKDLRNELEEYIFNTRAQLDGDLKQFMSGNDHEVVYSCLVETEEKLYGSESKDTYEFYRNVFDQLMSEIGFIVRKRDVFKRIIEVLKEIDDALSSFVETVSAVKKDYSLRIDLKITETNMQKLELYMDKQQLAYGALVKEFGTLSKLVDNTQFLRRVEDECARIKIELNQQLPPALRSDNQGSSELD